MTYSIIGTGNIAWFLAKRLTKAGHRCVGIYGRNEASARELAGIIIADTKQLRELKDGEADICFIALSDTAIADIARQLSFRQTVLIHTAGSVPIDVLQEGATDYGVLWPLYSILKNNLPTHRNIPCIWEVSTPRAQKAIQTIAHSITDVLYEAKEEQRRWLHLSAVISNNFTNHLMAISEQLCTDHNLPFAALHPIIAQTFERLKQESAYDIQTGPARRGDTPTIDKHLSLLASQPQWQRVYEALTSSIENMYNVNTKEKDVKP